MPRIVYGPRDVFVPLNPRSNRISYFRTHVYVEALDTQALIHIPYSRRECEWSAGFRLCPYRLESDCGEYVLISSNGNWYHTQDRPSGRVEVASGGHYAVRTEVPGANFVRVVADGKVGALIINDALPVWLELAAASRFRYCERMIESVDFIGSYFTGDGVAGKAIQFEALEIRSR